MKSGKFGLAALAAMALLGGCSSSETTTTTCTSDEYGVTDVQKITAQDDQVIRLEERLEIDFADLGMTEEDMAAFMAAFTEDDLQALFESEMPELAEDIEGVTFDYALDGTKAIMTMDVDLENADIGALADMGVLDTDTSNISLELSIAGLEEEGYTCQ